MAAVFAVYNQLGRNEAFSFQEHARRLRAGKACHAASDRMYYCRVLPNGFPKLRNPPQLVSGLGTWDVHQIGTYSTGVPC